MTLKEQRLIASLYIGLLILALVLVTSYLIGARDDHIGADTLAYKFYFDNLGATVSSDKFEPLFYLLAKFFYSFGSVEFFFGAINVLFVISIFTYLRVAFKDVDLLIFSLIFISFVLVSNWYLTAVTNGLRQGLATPFVFISYAFLYRRNWVGYFFFGAIACGFHYSSLLFIPFATLLLINRDSYFIFLYLLVSVFYPLGINEEFIRLFSDVLGVPVYQLIKNYAGGEGPWNGFNLMLYLYSNFWVCASLLFIYCFPNQVSKKLKIVVFTYASLIMPYFIFGFGPFSNRYAFAGWLYLPVLYASMCYFTRINIMYKLSIGLLVASFAILKFGITFI